LYNRVADSSNEDSQDCPKENEPFLNGENNLNYQAISSNSLNSHGSFNDNIAAPHDVKPTTTNGTALTHSASDNKFVSK